MPLPNPPAGDTRQQEEQYYEQHYIDKLDGVYEGSNAAYKGMTFPQIYQKLIASHPELSPGQLALVVIQLHAVAKLTNSIAEATGAAGTFPAKASQGVAQGFAKFTNPLDWLTSNSFWVRVGEVLVGLVLVGVGVTKLGANSQVIQAIPGVKTIRKFVK